MRMRRMELLAGGSEETAEAEVPPANGFSSSAPQQMLLEKTLNDLLHPGDNHE